MDGRPVARSNLRDSLVFWNDFFTQCLAQRLETDRFDTLVRMVHTRHPLPPAAIADLFLRPQPSNRNSLDPRVPLYLQTLATLGYIDSAAVLQALYKYSSLHGQLHTDEGPAQGEKDGSSGKQTRWWKSSYWVEEVMFYRLTKVLVEGREVQGSKNVLEIVKIVSKWMTLFTAASPSLGAEIMGQLPDAERRDEMESARAAFVALLMRLCDSEPLVRTITKPFAKGTVSPPWCVLYKATSRRTDRLFPRCSKDVFRKPREVHPNAAVGPSDHREARDVPCADTRQSRSCVKEAGGGQHGDGRAARIRGWHEQLLRSGDTYFQHAGRTLHISSGRGECPEFINPGKAVCTDLCRDDWEAVVG